jgi:hypothetical protein
MADLVAGFQHNRFHPAFEDVRRRSKADRAGSDDGDGFWLAHLFLP